MRLGVLLVLLGAGCSVREQCAATCKGCCDLQGACHPGTDPFACGPKGDCQACLAGQGCDGGCAGGESGSQLQLSGTNRFVAKSGQGFVYAQTDTAFIILSDLERKVCRDPKVLPNIDEQLLLVSMRHGGTPQFELMTFVDGGVRREVVVGMQTLRVAGDRVRGNVTVDTPAFRLDGPVDVPVCGVFR
ncbi:MAG: hypothetical protein Q8L48_20615 [Archangium sp.]|nr:hypothetical protein [Archangium sp.]